MTDRQKLLQAFPAVERYAATVLVFVCTLAIRLALDPFLGDRAPFLFFLLVIVVARHLWGRGPSLLATLLGGIATWYFILEPRFTFAITNRVDGLNLAAYFAVGVSISLLGDRRSLLPASKTGGGRTIRPRVIRQTVVLGGAAVVLAGMVLLLLQNLDRAQRAQGWVAHTYQVMQSADSVLSTMKDAETGERGFLLTDDETYLAPYNAAISALPHEMKDLNNLTSDNRQQQARFNELNRLTGERLSVLKHAIELRKAGQTAAALVLVRFGRGEPGMDKLRTTLDGVMNEERRLLAERTARAALENSRERWVLGLGSAALIFLLVFASAVIERETVWREEITEALGRHADLLEQAHDSLFTWPLGGTIDYWSHGAEILYGYTREEALGRNSHELLHTRHPLGMAQVDAMLERAGEWKGEFTQTTKDGRQLLVEGQWTVAVDASGGKTVLEANRDITARKQAEERLRESEMQFRTLANAIPQLCWMANADGWIFWYNERWYQYTGTTPEQMEGWGWKSVHDPETLPKVLERWAESIATSTPFDMIFPLRGADSAFRPFLTRVMPVRDKENKVVLWFGTNTDISEQRKNEEALRASEARLRTLGDNLPDGAIYRFCQDSNGKQYVDFISAGIERLTGIPAAEVMRDWGAVRETFPPADLERMKAAIAVSHERLTPFEIEVRHKHRVSGELRWSLLRSSPTRHPEGLTIWDGVELDITGMKKADAQNLLLATAIEQAAETVVVTDRCANIQYVNPAFSRTTGYTREEALGQNPRVLKSGQHDARFYEELWATVTAGKLWHGEFTNRRKDGTLYMEEATIAPVRDASREITNYIAIKFDITERKRAETALRESEMMLRFFVRHAPAAIAMLDLDMRYLVVSQRWITDYQLADRDVHGLSHYEVFPEISEHWREIHRQCMAGAVERCEEDAFRRPDGRIDWVRWEVRPWRKIDDTIGGIIIFSELITERKQAEEALLESEAHYRQLFQQSESALGVYEVLFDSEGNPNDYRYVDINPTWERITGLKPSQILGRTAREITPAIEDYWIKLFGHVAATGEPTAFEQYARHLERYYSGTAYSPRRNHVAVTFSDVTERIRAEDALRHLNLELEERVHTRTAALEDANRELEAFAHSVSHDLRAPLRGIDGWSMALLEDCGERLDAQGHKYLDRVRSEAQRMGGLIDDLLHLSRVGRTEMVPRTVDLTSLASDIVARLKEAYPGRSIEFIVAPQLQCTGDARLLEVALTNLLGNAVKFTGRCAHARVEFGKAEFEGKIAYFVRDNGAGFDMAYAKMLFAPFQRLHKTSEFPGTGIGLATVQRVIHRHGGRIWAEAKVGEGATIYFTLGADK